MNPPPRPPLPWSMRREWSVGTFLDPACVLVMEQEHEKEIAEFIVHRVNNWDKVVTALEACYLGLDPESAMPLDILRKRVEQALQSARGSDG